MRRAALGRRCRAADYIDFLIATPRAASCCEAARSGPKGPEPAAHDAYTRLLHRLEPDMAIRAFARLSWNFYATGVSWYEAKSAVVRAYRVRPLYRIPPIA